MQAPQCRNVSGACRCAPVMECVGGVFGVGTGFRPGMTSLSPGFAAPQRRAAILGAESRFVDRDERSRTADAGCSSFVGRIVAALDWRLQCLHVRDDNALADTDRSPHRRHCRSRWQAAESDACGPRNRRPLDAVVDGSVAGTTGAWAWRRQAGRREDASTTKPVSHRSMSHRRSQEAARRRDAGIVRTERHRGRA